jgi:hypothetical protein
MTGVCCQWWFCVAVDSGGQALLFCIGVGDCRSSLANVACCHNPCCRLVCKKVGSSGPPSTLDRSGVGSSGPAAPLDCMDTMQASSAVQPSMPRPVDAWTPSCVLPSRAKRAGRWGITMLHSRVCCTLLLQMHVLATKPLQQDLNSEQRNS